MPKSKSLVHLVVMLMVLLSSYAALRATAQAAPAVAKPAARAISKPSTYAWGTFTQIASGDTHTCALNSAGEAYCWGHGSNLQLGNGTITSSDTPVAVTMPAGVTFTSVSAGTRHTCAITTTDTAYCWGYPGPLGNGTSTTSTIPVAVTMPAGISFTAISAGDVHSCALTTTGTAYCWGDGSRGGLGNGSYNSSTPVAVTMPAGVSFTAVYAGYESTCALTTTGTAYCWGYNYHGQLGNGTDGNGTNSMTPVAVTMPAGVSFTAVTMSLIGTCALTTTGTIYCWGGNYEGQLGNGSGTLRSSTPVAVTMPAGVSFTAVKSGYRSTCALTSTGTAYCWGGNNGANLGNGTVTNSSTPVVVTMPAGVSFTSITSGGYNACAVTSTGTAYCWGYNNAGQIGDCTTTRRSTPTLVSGCAPAATDTPTASNTSTPSRTNTPAASNTSTPSRTNTPAGGGSPSRTPTRSATVVPGSDPWGTFTQIEPGEAYTCALNSAGAAYCWGYGVNGQLGNGTTTYSTTPVAVTMPAGVSFTAISSGYYHTCALTTTGTAYCWGNNGDGKLGNGTTTNSAIPVAVTMPAGVAFTAISAGTGAANGFTCALTAAGTAYCWGWNNKGQLGNGTTTQSNIPVAVTMPAGVTFTTISNGGYNTCALTTTGTAYCWGDNSGGQLGNGTTTESTTPVVVTMPAGVTFSSVSVSNSTSHTCALTTTGTAYCWGNNSIGQLGVCDFVDRFIPTLVSSCAPAATDTPTRTNTPAGTSTRTSTPSRTPTRSATAVPGSWGTFTQIASGNQYTCALNSAGAAYCWGYGFNGQLGNGTTTTSATPVAVTMPTGVTFTTISTGSYHTCALTTTGTAYCWGWNNNGQLGNGTTTQSNTPVAVTMPAGVTFTAISAGAGNGFTCALTAAGTAYCWGGWDRTGSATPVAVTMPTGVTFTTISAGYSHTCALTAAGTAYCWGLNNNGQLGNGTNIDSFTPVAVTMPAGVTFTAISAGTGTDYDFTCALTAAGTTYCWGDNFYGQLGNGTTTDSNTPVAVTMPAGVTFVAISAGFTHTCALTTTGTAYCWGENPYGTLGNGTTTNSTTPMVVTMPAGISFTAISAGDFHTCAVTTTGTAYCWGYNNAGQLGMCDLVNRNIPTRVSGCAPAGTSTRTPSNTRTSTSTRTASRTPTPPSYPWGIFTSIDTGAYHTCAIATTGAAFCWGSNMFGQLGNGTTTWSATPSAVTVPTGVTFVAISAGFTHTCALTAAGAAYCWGSNLFGQLGVGSTDDSATPVAVTMPAGVTFVTIVVSTYHTCALTASGDVYCWGINRANQLGDGTTTDRTTPVLVTMPTGITFTRITSGGHSTCALTASGAAYCWGANTSGQLGIGSTSNAAVPTAVTMPSGVTFVFITVGRNHTCALTAAGAAYCWGLNTGGALGDGTTTNRTTPVAVTMPSGVTFDTISAGWNHTCALTAGGIAYCWGQNSGQIGDGTTTNRTTPVLVSMPTGMTFDDIMAGATHTCALAGNGLAYCWGTNTNGQLGLCNCITYTRPSQVGLVCAQNTATPTITPTPSDTRTPSNTVTPSNTRVPSNTVTPSNTRVPSNTLTPSNTRTETNTPTDTSTPTSTRTATNTRTASNTRTFTPSATATATPQLLALKKAAVGNLFVIGLLQNGTLVAWGKTPGSVIPSTLKGKTFIDVAATLDTAFALESDGTLHYFGGCSDGVCTVPDDAKTGVIAIGAGARFAYAIRSDNTLIGWGKNDFAQVSIPDTATSITAVDGGARHAVALRADGTVIGWGDNTLGQARPPDGLSNIVAVSAGEDHSCALSNKGEVICWGGGPGKENTWGKIPKGTKGYTSIAAGRFCTLAIQANGTVVRWGKEEFSFFGKVPITNGIIVASDNQNSVVGLSNNGVRVAGNNFEGVNITRTPTLTPTP